MKPETRNFYRPTVALIDQGAFVRNLECIRRRIGSAPKLMAIVKANAYGHGAVQLAKFAVSGEADWLAVATIDEALELRDAGINAPILVLSAIMPDQASALIENDLRAVVPSLELAGTFNDAAASLGIRAKIHVKVDTGMGRIGFWHEEIETVMDTLAHLEHLEIEGLLTHFPESDSADKTFTQWQIKRFGEIRTSLEAKGFRIPLYHAANSGAILDHPDSYFDMVRAGIITYGIYPSDECSRNLDLEPVMTLKTKVAFIKEIAKGRTISYGRTFEASNAMRVATLPIGYADGIPRYLSNKGEVVIRGKRAPIVGRVTMDQIMVDLTDVLDVEVGEDVLIFGRLGDDVLSAEEFASMAGTIGYEVVCWVSRRVPRVFLEERSA